MAKKKSTKTAKKANRPAKKAVRVIKKSATKKAAYGRASGKTQISISLDNDLVDKVDRLAAAENRNRSNFITNVLEGL